MTTPDSPVGPVSRVGLVAKAGLREAAELLAGVTSWLEQRGVQPILEADTASLAGLSDGRATARQEDLPRLVDLVLVLGGDGTLLGMADRIAQAGVDIPILGVNFGSLGFLTEVTLAEVYPSLESVLAGTALTEPRLMLRARTYRGDVTIADRLVVNDVVIARGALSPIIDLSVSVGAEFVTRVRADGLIIASPTGSTAYNLSAGGPIVHPAVDAIVITPIAPHTLTNRPVVISAREEVRIQARVDEDSLEACVTFDGQFGIRLTGHDVVSIARAERPMQLVRASARTYFEVLRQKLKWGER